jgi:charged multivesicular body protein 7
MSKFQGMCGGPSEAAPLLSYLSGLGKAQYLSISKEVIEVLKYGFLFTFL